jgi:hypothetical protein
MHLRENVDARGWPVEVELEVLLGGHALARDLREDVAVDVEVVRGHARLELVTSSGHPNSGSMLVCAAIVDAFSRMDRIARSAWPFCWLV